MRNTSHKNPPNHRWRIIALNHLVESSRSSRWLKLGAISYSQQQRFCPERWGRQEIGKNEISMGIASYTKKYNSETRWIFFCTWTVDVVNLTNMRVSVQTEFFFILFNDAYQGLLVHFSKSFNYCVFSNFCLRTNQCFGTINFERLICDTKYYLKISAG